MCAASLYVCVRVGRCFQSTFVRCQLATANARPLVPPFRIDRCHHRNKFSFVFVQQAALWSNKLLITPFRRRPFPCIAILPSLNALARSTSSSRHSEAIHVCVLHQESSPSVEGVHIFSTTTVACTMLVNGWEFLEVNFTQ